VSWGDEEKAHASSKQGWPVCLSQSKHTSPCLVPLAAYEVLSDAEKRKIYDRYGEEGVKEHAGQKASGRQPGGNIFDM